jgi:hypothetical protein
LVSSRVLDHLAATFARPRRPGVKIGSSMCFGKMRHTAFSWPITESLTMPRILDRLATRLAFYFGAAAASLARPRVRSFSPRSDGADICRRLQKLRSVRSFR